jgi:hypothetical protein
MEPVLVLLREAGQHAVEDVVVPLLKMSSFYMKVEKTTFLKHVIPFTHGRRNFKDTNPFMSFSLVILFGVVK